MNAELDKTESNYSEQPEVVEEDFILPSGDTLSFDEMYEISSSEKSIYSVIMGPTGCGKESDFLTV